MSAWKFLRGNRVAVRATVGATAIVYPNTPVILSSNAVIPASDGQQPWGVAVTPGAIGAQVMVDIGGDSIYQANAAFGVNFAYGDPIYLAASYEVDTGTSGNLSCGNVIDYNPASAGLVVFVATPTGKAVTTHA